MAASPTLSTVPELRYEEMTGEELAQEVANLSGMTVEEVKSDGVQTSLVALHLSAGIPDNREDLIRLATGESFVRPTAFTRVHPDPNAAGVLVVEVPLGTNADEVMVAEVTNGPQQIDAALGIRTGPNEATASAAVPAANAANASETATASIGRSWTAPPIDSTHLMSEKVWDHTLSRNGKVNREVCHALNLMNLGTDLKKIWRRLDDYVTVDNRDVKDKIENDACEMANRMMEAQVRLAEAVYKREWSEECPIISLHLTNVSNNVNQCMLETGWFAMTKAERMIWSHVYDWILLPSSIGQHYFETGEIDLSRFPCHQLNGSFCALTAMRKTVQWFCQGVFDENAPYERLVFLARRRSTAEAAREWTGVTTGAKKMKLANYFNRQFTGHISTQNGVHVENEEKNVPSRWTWTVPSDASRMSMGIIRMTMDDPMSYAQSGHQLLCLSEMMDWNRLATLPHRLEHDCSTWDEMYGEDDGEDPNVWNAPASSSTAAPKKTAGTTSQGSSATVLAQVANALSPGAEVVLRMNANAKAVKK
ncbi:yqkD [Symbiodinium sp. CCMP2456]|nr:yqkD [Symbiodinium sp. CCMP2456]